MPYADHYGGAAPSACPVCFRYIILPLSLFSEGPCLIHSMNGDLLRTLEGPENCLKPKLIQASREGHCVIFYENGCFCTFSVNGKLQATMETDDHIRVSAVGSTLFILLGSFTGKEDKFTEEAHFELPGASFPCQRDSTS